MTAASAQAEPVTFTLTEAQKQEILSAKAEAELAAPTLTTSAFDDPRFSSNPDDLPRLSDRRPRGEIGMMVGTGGARGVYGVTSVPLGSNGSATFGFENSRNLWPGRY